MNDKTTLAELSVMEQRLTLATVPEETRPIEAASAAARAWARENQNYELLVNATRLYILARRKTTELIRPYIIHGDHRGNTDVTSLPVLADFGFTKAQWYRRVRETEIPLDTLNVYFDECIENGWHPSLAGFVRHAQRTEAANDSTKSERQLCPYCGRPL